MSIFTQKAELLAEEAELRVEEQLQTFPPLAKWFAILGLLLALPGYFVAKNIAFKTYEKKLAGLAITAHPAFVNPLDLKVTEVQASQIAPGIYSASAKITNENFELSGKEFFYRFKFYNQEGKEAGILDEGTIGSEYILPGEVKYIVAPRISSKETLFSASLDITKEPVWQKKLALPQIKISAYASSFSQAQNSNAFSAEGVVQNQSPYHIKKIQLKFLVYDSTNQILATSQRDEFDLNLGEKRAFKQLWPNINLSQAVRVKVFAYVNSLDEGNLYAPERPEGSASDLSRPEIEW